MKTRFFIRISCPLKIYSSINFPKISTKNLRGNRHFFHSSSREDLEIRISIIFQFSSIASMNVIAVGRSISRCQPQFFPFPACVCISDVRIAAGTMLADSADYLGRAEERRERNRGGIDRGWKVCRYVEGRLSFVPEARSSAEARGVRWRERWKSPLRDRGPRFTWDCYLWGFEGDFSRLPAHSPEWLLWFADQVAFNHVRGPWNRVSRKVRLLKSYIHFKKLRYLIYIIFLLLLYVLLVSLWYEEFYEKHFAQNIFH